MTQYRSKFQRRHYEAIAQVMASEFPTLGKLERDMVWIGIVSGLSMMFEEDNPNFDKARFVLACTGV
jgi:hypothetical protein